MDPFTHRGMVDALTRIATGAAARPTDLARITRGLRRSEAMEGFPLDEFTAALIAQDERRPERSPRFSMR